MADDLRPHLYAVPKKWILAKGFRHGRRIVSGDKAGFGDCDQPFGTADTFTTLGGLTQRQCSRIAEQLNNRPTLRLGFKTPNEVYY
jgi:hypothetical protein